MAKANCLICGSEYEVCRHCPETTLNTPWRNLCDTSVHYQVYAVIQDLQAKTLSASEAKERLDYIKVTIDDVKRFLPAVQDILLPLFKEVEPEMAEESTEQPKKRLKNGIAKSVKTEEVE